MAASSCLLDVLFGQVAAGPRLTPTFWKFYSWVLASEMPPHRLRATMERARLAAGDDQLDIHWQ